MRSGFADEVQPPNWRTLAVDSAILLAVILAQLAIADGFYRFQRALWLDEIFTHLHVTAPTISKMMQGIRVGIDASPPTLHFFLRGWNLATFGWGATEVGLRVFSFGSVIVALIGFNLYLRRAFSRTVALAATFALWVSPLVETYAFDARFYGPLLAASIWYALLLSKAVEGKANVAVWTALCFVSLVLCTVHYFGVLSLGLVSIGQFIARPVYGRPFLKIASVVAPGPLALGVWIALVMVHQLEGFAEKTWVDEATLKSAALFLVPLFLQPFIWLPLFLGWFVHWASLWMSGTRLNRGRWMEQDRILPQLRSVAGLLSLSLIPVLLLVISENLQPVLQPRYAISAAVVSPTLAAMVYARINGRMVVAVCVLMLAMKGVILERNATYRVEDRGLAAAIAFLRTTTQPIVFERQKILVEEWFYAKDLRNRLFLISFSPNEMPPQLKRQHARFTQDHHQLLVDVFEGPKPFAYEELRSMSEFLYVSSGRNHGLHTRIFPNHTAKRMFGQVYLLRKKEPT